MGKDPFKISSEHGNMVWFKVIGWASMSMILAYYAVCREAL
jgi:hypothetical protein